MKKLLNLLLIACFCIFMTACGNEQPAADNTTGESQNSTTQEETTEEKTTETETTEAEITEAETTETEATEAETPQDTAQSKTLVVYFSNTGNTKAIAENIANGLGADIYEIVAAVPYTAEDLNYNDNNSRSTLEMNDSSVRPAITGSVENMEQYDTVYIGYPIWWGEAPRILDTFVESYDFTGKTVIPFCTSASGGIGSSASGLESLAGSGNWMAGRRFSGSESADTVMEWVNGL